MSMLLALALASSSVVPPQSGGTQDPGILVTPAAVEVPDESGGGEGEPEVVSEAAWVGGSVAQVPGIELAKPASAPVVPMTVGVVAPPKPMSGVGLLSLSSMIFMVGLSTHVTAGVVQSGYCKGWRARGYNTAHGCFHDNEPWIAHGASGFAYGSSLILAGVGGAALGRRDAWESVVGDHRQRNARASVGVGAVLVAFGVAAGVAEAALLPRELYTYCSSYACEVDRRQTYYGLAGASALGLTVGTGLMTYGVAYRRHREGYLGSLRWSLSPRASARLLGASASLRF
ncbi:hypothetical protein G6O69_06230 [Pseudenhygromyxa sp. WMMC2535]|uniref:hypothetical protein n=1 Tax=Pseudenhygromyxa sp. WMMC2535 TaxID=2712867 RepID=UPI001552FF71|nr:hypothetical protein [Pseudenhygromyxa sp. WMMC2535]NVB37421.1 hypothetical protein [Pseudenhygromyxa sp. WMMC2535]